jgi:hypothetical protein
VSDPYKNTPCRCEPAPQEVLQAIEAIRKPVDAAVQYLRDLVNAAVLAPTQGDSLRYQTAAREYITACVVTAQSLQGSVNTQGLLDRMTRFCVNALAVLVRLDDNADKSVCAAFRGMNEAHRQAFMARENNLRMWCILDTALTGLVCRDAALVDRARAEFADACRTLIRADGSVPAESARGGRADEYHEYFLQAAALCVYYLRGGPIGTPPQLDALASRVRRAQQSAGGGSRGLYIYDATMNNRRRAAGSAAAGGGDEDYIAGMLAWFAA